MANEAMTEQKGLGEVHAEEVGTSANGEVAAIEQASAALTGLRSAIDHASRSLRELSRAGEEWAEGRAVEIGKGLRSQGERAVGGVARQVEHNPLASVAVAFVLGFLCATLARRDNR